MGRIGDTRSAKQVQVDLETQRNLRMKNASALLFDLADAGFTHLWMEVTQITGHGDFFIRIILDEVDIHHKRFDTALTIANAHSAKASMHEVRMNQMSFSRLTFWPAGDE